MAHGHTGARRRRIRTTCPRLAARASVESHCSIRQAPPVYACSAGTVTVAGPVAGRSVVSILHSVGGRDIWSTYLPITPTVVVGEHVEKGDMIGVIEGDSQTLHWGAKTGRRTYINPIRMTLGHPRLLPWDDAP